MADPRRRRRHVVLVGLALAVLAAPAAIGQRAPYDDRGPRYGSSRPGLGTGGLPGKFDYYALVLSWSPTYCAGLDRRDRDPQCSARDGRRYAFVLHGLWPQYERGYPEHCATRERPFVPQPVIDRMLDIMPSPRLVIHEYRKHGTCSGLDPAGYYALSRALFGKVKIPQRYVSPAAAMFVSPVELAREFLGANPALKPDMLAIACNRGGGGNRLKEVRVCFSREGEPRACGANEDQRRLCSADRMYVPPARPGAPGEPSPLPGPGPAPSGQRSL